MENILFILVLLFIGIALKRLPAFPESSAQVLTTFVIYISLPALILVKIPELEISPDILIPALMPWAMLIVSAILVLGFSKLFGWTKSVTGALMLLVPLGNTSFFGIPMVESFFGGDHVSYALLYDQLGTFLALATYGTIIIAVYSEKEGQTEVSARAITKKILTFPPLLALILAFILSSWTIPSTVDFILESLAATLIPLVIIAVGLKLEFKIEKEDLNPMAIGLGIKLIIAPLIALAIIKSFGFNSPAAKVAVFEAGMPSQISAWALAMLAGLSPKLGAMMVGIGILISFLTLSFLYTLL